MLHPQNNFMSKWYLIQPVQREIYKTPTLISWIFLYGTKLFGHVSHSTKPLRMCLARQHFSNADWFYDNLHTSSSWCLLTMWKEFSHSIQQTFEGQERVTNPKERMRERLSKQLRNIKVSLSVQVHWCVLQLNVCIRLFWATRGRKEESLHIASKFQPLWMTTYSNWTCRLRILQNMMLIETILHEI